MKKINDYDFDVDYDFDQGPWCPYNITTRMIA